MQSRIKKITFTALFCAIAYLCVFIFRFSGIGGFLTLDAKDAVLVLCGLFFGPVYGIGATLVVATLEAVTVSGTGIWGLFMNFLSSGAFVFVSSLLYRRFRTFRGAIGSLAAGVLAVVAVMLPANLFITPLYMHVGRDAVLALLLPLLLPFNLLKSIGNASLVLLLYKPLSRAMKRLGVLPGKPDSRVASRRTLLVALTAMLLLAGCVCLVVFWLGGSFEIFRR